jgi:hypothetical protein
MTKRYKYRVEPYQTLKNCQGLGFARIRGKFPPKIAPRTLYTQ